MVVSLTAQTAGCLTCGANRWTDILGCLLAAFVLAIVVERRHGRLGADFHTDSMELNYCHVPQRMLGVSSACVLTVRCDVCTRGGQRSRR